MSDETEGRRGMTIEEARKLAGHSFRRLWASKVVSCQQAHEWLAATFNGAESVDVLDMDQLEQLSRSLCEWWANATTADCPWCHEPVGQDEPHVLLGNEVFHAACVGDLDVDVQMGVQ